MTLKEELEILRGEPIEVFEGDPMDIPCIETSDREKICKHPVVSVQMCTYNHEAYIRQAIEGVLMQKTDFEFELVIGEDCSQDKTREICFEYQKKHPDKIRVLWWHENVSRLGGNSRRVTAHCRGEFIAYCEGDDYWIDPLKLQKQVEVMKQHPNVGFCFCGSKRFYQSENRFDDWNENCVTYNAGVQNKDWFFATFMFGMGPEYAGKSYAGFIMTATTMARRSLFQKIEGRFDVFKWRLRLGDATLWLACSSYMDCYYINDQVSVYRISDSGVFNNNVTRIGVQIDGIIVRLYFLIRVWGLKLSDCPRNILLWLTFLVIAKLKMRQRIMRFARAQWKLPLSMLAVQYRWYMLLFWICSILGLYMWPFRGIVNRIALYGSKHHNWSQAMLGKYKAVGLF